MRVNTCVFFLPSGLEKRKEKARLWWKTRNKNSSKFVLARGGRKKTKTQPKSKFLFSSSRFFFEWVSHDENFFFFFSFLLILCARWHFFTNLLSYHPNTPKTFNHRSWYMHTRALTKYHPHKPALTCIFSSFLNQNRKWTLRRRKWTREPFFFEFEFHTLNNRKERRVFQSRLAPLSCAPLCVCVCTPCARGKRKKWTKTRVRRTKLSLEMGITLTIAQRRHHRYVFVSLFLSYRSPVVDGERAKFKRENSLISLSLSLTLLIPKKLTLFLFPHD